MLPYTPRQLSPPLPALLFSRSPLHPFASCPQLVLCPADRQPTTTSLFCPRHPSLQLPKLLLAAHCDSSRQSKAKPHLVEALQHQAPPNSIAGPGTSFIPLLPRAGSSSTLHRRLSCDWRPCACLHELSQPAHACKPPRASRLLLQVTVTSPVRPR